MMTKVNPQIKWPNAECYGSRLVSGIRHGSWNWIVNHSLPGLFWHRNNDSSLATLCFQWAAILSQYGLDIAHIDDHAFKSPRLNGPGLALLVNSVRAIIDKSTREAAEKMLMKLVKDLQAQNLTRTWGQAFALPKDDTNHDVKRIQLGKHNRPLKELKPSLKHNTNTAIPMYTQHDIKATPCKDIRIYFKQGFTTGATLQHQIFCYQWWPTKSYQP